MRFAPRLHALPRRVSVLLTAALGSLRETELGIKHRCGKIVHWNFGMFLCEKGPMRMQFPPPLPPAAIAHAVVVCAAGCSMTTRLQRVVQILQTGNLRELMHLALRMLSVDVGADVRPTLDDMGCEQRARAS